MSHSTLVDTEHSAEFNEYVEEAGIRHIRILVPAHKTPSLIIPIKTIIDIQKIMLDSTCHPMLVHCNKGKVSLIPVPARVKQAKPNTYHSTEQDVWWPATGSSKAGKCPPSSRSMCRLLHPHQPNTLIISQIPQIRRCQISTSRRSIHDHLQRRHLREDPQRE